MTYLSFGMLHTNYWNIYNPYIHVEVALGQNRQMYKNPAAWGGGLPYDSGSNERVKRFVTDNKVYFEYLNILSTNVIWCIQLLRSIYYLQRKFAIKWKIPNYCWQQFRQDNFTLSIYLS